MIEEQRGQARNEPKSNHKAGINIAQGIMKQMRSPAYKIMNRASEDKGSFISKVEQFSYQSNPGLSGPKFSNFMGDNNPLVSTNKKSKNELS